jgi:hypothetical protein
LKLGYYELDYNDQDIQSPNDHFTIQINQVMTCSQFHQYFKSSFLLISFPAKITDPNCIRTLKASKNTFVQKSSS